MNVALGVLALVIGAGPASADLAGAWQGTVTHEGETQQVGLELEPTADGKLTLYFSLPVVHWHRVEFGTVALESAGTELKLGPFKLAYDAQAQTLRGMMPAALVPVYEIPMALRKVERLEFPRRRPAEGTLAQPVWTFETGAAQWAGPTFADGLLFTGGQDGRLHAIAARTGTPRWSFQAGGPIRTRPAVAHGALYLQADDGMLYKLAADDGKERWRVRLFDGSVERLPFDNPKSRYDRFGSDVVVTGGRIYVGTHAGTLQALDPGSGKRVWEFAASDAILAAPAVVGGRVYFGSFDKHVYALDAATGRLLWKRDTKGAVVSTPAVDGDRVVVGNRCYDLLGLDAATGAIAWKRYVWSSWVESSATIRDAIAYVGSSDAAAVFAYDVRTGERRWAADVFGWTWGQPAVTQQRIYAGASSQVGYLAQHVGGLFAIDRASGRPLWRFATPAPASGPYGIAGSPALGAGFVFVTGLDGKVMAFRE